MPGISSAAIDGDVALEFLVGAPVNATTSLDIRQRGHDRITLDARFRSVPFEPPIYWAVRASMGDVTSRWCLEFMHDKLYLDTSHPDVQSFSISHGLNFVTLQHRWIRDRVELNVGGGVIAAHPESTIRFQGLDPDTGIRGSGYHLTGPAALASAAYRLPLWCELSVVAELRASVARVGVPVSSGDARFMHLAGHLLIGLATFVL